MQRARTLLMAVMPLVLISASALASAGFTPSTLGGEPATAGKLELIVTGYSVISKPSYVTVSVSGVGSGAITIAASPFAPGDSVVIGITITNTGTLPATSLEDRVRLTNTYDKAFRLIVGELPERLAAGHSATIKHTIKLASGLPNAAQGASMTGTVTITAEHGESGKEHE